MKENKYSVLKRVKKLKIPNAPRKYSSIVFESLYSDPLKFSAFKKTATPQELLPKPKENLNKQQRKAQYNVALRRIKELFPTEASKLGKKTRRKHKHLFSEFEWPIFCWYVKSCHRGIRRQRRKAKGERVSSRQSYNNFINSPEWTEIKNRYWQNYTRRCEICYTARRIHLHHMVYGSFGQEKDEDLIPLCEPHHNEYHAKNGTQRNMKERTMAFIEQKRDFIPGLPKTSL